MKKYLVTAAFDRHYRPFIESSHRTRMERWCKKWGYEFKPEYKMLDLSPHSSPNWMQVKMVRDQLAKSDEGDIVLWLDADVLIVDGRKELRLDKSIGVTFDYYGEPVEDDWYGPFDSDVAWGPNRINAGVFIVKNNEFVRRYYDGVWAVTKWDGHCLNSQICLAEGINEIGAEEKDDHIQFLPRCFNVTKSSNMRDEEAIFMHFANDPDKYYDESWQKREMLF